MICYSYHTHLGLNGHPLVEQQLARACRYYNTILDIERERRAAAPPAADDATKTKAKEAANAAIRRERTKHSGLYWGTYLLVEDAAQRAAAATKPGDDLHPRRWDGSGVIGVQIHGDCDPFSGEDSRVRIRPVDATISGDPEARRERPDIHRIVSLRVGSNTDRSPIFVDVPILYDRPLPEGAKLKWVRLHKQRNGPRFRWSLQFVLDDSACAGVRPALIPHTVAIDLGWRKLDTGCRVAVAIDSAGGVHELRLPQSILDRWQNVQDLESIRKKNFNGALEFVLAHREAGGWPEWLMLATKTAPSWKSAGRLSDLAFRWWKGLYGAARFDGDEDLYDTLQAWAKQDRHLLQWEAGARRHVLLARREHYRQFAQSMAKYERVVIEGRSAAKAEEEPEAMDLRPFVELPDGPDDPVVAAARGRRFRVALYELRLEQKRACAKSGSRLETSPAKDTTRRCHACDAIEKWDQAKELRHVCSGCGAEWDQDENAARNLLRAAMRGDSKPIRSKTKHEEKTGETAAAARRRKGLATRRAKRSKAAAEVADLTTE